MFVDRFDAGNQLGQALSDYAERKNVIVLGIPRGGVEIGSVVAKELKAELDIVVTKKIGFPGNPEAAIGAVTPDGKASVDKSWIDYAGISKSYIEKEVKGIKEEIKRRYKEYRGKAKAPKLRGSIVIVVDDGIATGQSVRATAEYLRKEKPKKLILAIPVAPKDIVEELRKVFDEVVCLQTPLIFYSIGQFYSSFEDLTDDKVKGYLGIAKKKGR
ncbi:phosphoribosyltransferase [Candidatus Woesearchaeota archaeon]|nr:phosphoribosyltransferase [Candidatus Woesearchaeota archaeon]